MGDREQRSQHYQKRVDALFSPRPSPHKQPKISYRNESYALFSDDTANYANNVVYTKEADQTGP